MHPDVNPNPNAKWIDTITGKAMAAAGVGVSLDLKNLWSHSEKRMVLLDASISNQTAEAIPQRKPQKVKKVKFYDQWPQQFPTVQVIPTARRVVG